MSIDTVSEPPIYTSPAADRKAPAVLQLVPNFDAGGASRLALEIAGAVTVAGGVPIWVTSRPWFRAMSCRAMA